MGFGVSLGSLCLGLFGPNSILCHVIFFGLIRMRFTSYGMCCGIVLVLFGVVWFDRGLVLFGVV